MVQMCVKVSINAAGKYRDSITDELCGVELLREASVERQAEGVRSEANPEDQPLNRIKNASHHIQCDPLTKLQIKV